MDCGEGVEHGLVRHFGPSLERYFLWTVCLVTPRDAPMVSHDQFSLRARMT